ncbi:MAG: hypothetical protein ABF899_05105 [Oenococcus sp.]|uniref:hypothetical protein n=1 Tax=Oenococcus sp. TaxID=1979414 RepID=UPI0039EC84C2
MKLGKAKLSEVEISNVEKPKEARVVSVSKSPRYGDNGEPINGSVAKIACQVVDSTKAILLEKAGDDVSDLKTFSLELVGDEKDLLEVSEASLLGTDIQLANAKVMLKWSTGRTSGWRELKLVMNISNEK